MESFTENIEPLEAEQTSLFIFICTHIYTWVDPIH